MEILFVIPGGLGLIFTLFAGMVIGRWLGRYDGLVSLLPQETQKIINKKISEKMERRIALWAPVFIMAWPFTLLPFALRTEPIWFWLLIMFVIEWIVLLVLFIFAARTRIRMIKDVLSNIKIDSVALLSQSAANESVQEKIFTP